MSDLRNLSEAATPGEWGGDMNGFASPRLFATGFETYDGSEVLAHFRRSDGVSHEQTVANRDYVAALVRGHRSGSLIPRSEYERVLELLAEAREAFGAVLALEGNTSPFGGELMRDRIERTLERARATLSRIDDALAAEPEAKS